MPDSKRDKDEAKPIVVETEALKAMTFYAHNYETLYFRALRPDGKREVLGSKPPRCRFCGRGKPEARFSKDAHVVPAFVGNKVLFSRYECDDCNDRFSAFEDDLAKMTLGDRAVGQVPKRNGFTALKPDGKKSSFRRGPAGVVINQYVDEGVFEIDETASRLVVNHETQPFRPLGAYKALAKMACALLPEAELPQFEELRQWLLQADVETRKVYGAGGHWSWSTFVPGPAPFAHPIVALLRRKQAVDAPYLTFFLAFGNWSYQIFPPCPRKDIGLADRRIDIVPYPHLYQMQPWLARGRIQARQLPMDDPTRRSEPQTLNLHFDAIRPGGGAPASEPPA